MKTRGPEKPHFQPNENDNECLECGEVTETIGASLYAEDCYFCPGCWEMVADREYADYRDHIEKHGDPDDDSADRTFAY